MRREYHSLPRMILSGQIVSFSRRMNSIWTKLRSILTPPASASLCARLGPTRALGAGMTKTILHMESLLALALVNNIPTEAERIRVLRVLQELVDRMVKEH